MYDVIIIGSGPAGLTAAIYTSRANLKTLVIAGANPGGQLMLTSEVENYPGFPDGIMGPELMEKMKQQATRFKTETGSGNVTKVDFLGELKKVYVGDQRYEGRIIIIATGADNVWLGLPNEQRLIGHGVSSCAPCDAFFFKNKKVVVVGGGDSAMEEALFLTKFASEVIIVHRRDSFKASKIMQDRVLSHPKIKVTWDSQVVDVLGEEKVTGVVLQSTNNQKQTTVNCDGVFVAIGHSPNTKIFAGQVELDEKGFVMKDQRSKIKDQNNNQIENSKYQMMTSVEGVFVAGDVHDHHYKQAVTAAGFGCMAALEVEKWLEENHNA